MRWTAASLCIAGAATALLLAHATFGGQPNAQRQSRVEESAGGEAGAAATEDAQPGDNLSDAMIDEIRRIRRRLDLDPLKGSSLERPPKKVGETASETNPLQHNSRSVCPDDDAEFADTLRKYAPRFAERPASEDRVFYESKGVSTSSSEQQFVASLQTAARQMAFRAEVLEQRREYSAADRLRRLARKIRRQARNAAR
jgi:hypothetical protein